MIKGKPQVVFIDRGNLFTVSNVEF